MPYPLASMTWSRVSSLTQRQSISPMSRRQKSPNFTPPKQIRHQESNKSLAWSVPQRKGHRSDPKRLQPRVHPTPKSHNSKILKTHLAPSITPYLPHPSAPKLTTPQFSQISSSFSSTFSTSSSSCSGKIVLLFSSRGTKYLLFPIMRSWCWSHYRRPSSGVSPFSPPAWEFNLSRSYNSSLAFFNLAKINPLARSITSQNSPWRRTHFNRSRKESR